MDSPPANHRLGLNYNTDGSQFASMPSMPSLTSEMTLNSPAASYGSVTRMDASSELYFLRTPYDASVLRSPSVVASMRIRNTPETAPIELNHLLDRQSLDVKYLQLEMDSLKREKGDLERDNLQLRKKAEELELSAHQAIERARIDERTSLLAEIHSRRLENSTRKTVVEVHSPDPSAFRYTPSRHERAALSPLTVSNLNSSGKMFPSLHANQKSRSTVGSDSSRGTPAARTKQFVHRGVSNTASRTLPPPIPAPKLAPEPSLQPRGLVTSPEPDDTQSSWDLDPEDYSLYENAQLPKRKPIPSFTPSPTQGSSVTTHTHIQVHAPPVIESTLSVQRNSSVRDRSASHRTKPKTPSKEVLFVPRQATSGRSSLGVGDSLSPPTRKRTGRHSDQPPARGVLLSDVGHSEVGGHRSEVEEGLSMHAMQLELNAASIRQKTLRDVVGIGRLSGSDVFIPNQRDHHPKESISSKVQHHPGDRAKMEKAQHGSGTGGRSSLGRPRHSLSPRRDEPRDSQFDRALEPRSQLQPDVSLFNLSTFAVSGGLNSFRSISTALDSIPDDRKSQDSNSSPHHKTTKHNVAPGYPRTYSNARPPGSIVGGRRSGTPAVDSSVKNLSWSPRIGLSLGQRAARDRGESSLHKSLPRVDAAFRSEAESWINAEGSPRPDFGREEEKENRRPYTHSNVSHQTGTHLTPGYQRHRDISQTLLSSILREPPISQDDRHSGERFTHQNRGLDNRSSHELQSEHTKLQRSLPSSIKWDTLSRVPESALHDHLHSSRVSESTNLRLRAEHRRHRDEVARLQRYQDDSRSSIGSTAVNYESRRPRSSLSIIAGSDYELRPSDSVSRVASAAPSPYIHSASSPSEFQREENSIRRPMGNPHDPFYQDNPRRPLNDFEPLFHVVAASPRSSRSFSIASSFSGTHLPDLPPIPVTTPSPQSTPSHHAAPRVSSLLTPIVPRKSRSNRDKKRVGDGQGLGFLEPSGRPAYDDAKKELQDHRDPQGDENVKQNLGLRGVPLLEDAACQVVLDSGVPLGIPVSFDVIAQRLLNQSEYNRLVNDIVMYDRQLVSAHTLLARAQHIFIAPDRTDDVVSHIRSERLDAFRQLASLLRELEKELAELGLEGTRVFSGMSTTRSAP